MARALGRRLVVQNMSVQSDSTDLIGGYKPVELGKLAVPVFNRESMETMETVYVCVWGGGTRVLETHRESKQTKQTNVRNAYVRAQASSPSSPPPFPRARTRGFSMSRAASSRSAST